MPSEACVAARMAMLDRVARDTFRYAGGLRPFQRAVCEVALSGGRVLGVAGTGAGKSITYQAPALIFQGPTLVVSPLLSLMKDQVDKLKRWGVRAARLGSDMPADERARVVRGIAAGAHQLVYIAPERLVSRSFRTAIGGAALGAIALDECHTISTWSKEFRPSYCHLRDFIAARPRVPLLMLTATADRRVEEDLRHVLGLAEGSYRRVIDPPDRPNLEYTASAEMTLDQLAGMVRAQLAAGPGCAITYCSTRKRVEEVAEALTAAGIRTEAYHGGLNGVTRQSLLERFVAGGVPSTAATSAFGMGVDRGDVRLVVHWDQPGSAFDYFQQAGRAGRDGAPARCHLNVSKRGRRTVGRFTDMANPPLWVYERLWKIVTKYGAVPAGDRVVTRREVLAERMRLPEHHAGWLDSAMGYLEFTGHFDALPGPRSYVLATRDIDALRPFLRVPGVRQRGNTIEVKMDDPEADDPVPEMVAAGAVWERDADEGVILRIRRADLAVTQEIIDAKRGDAEHAAADVERFAITKDKPGFLRRLFLPEGRS